MFLFFWYNISRGGVTLIAGVLVELSNKNIDKVFSYNVPRELENKMRIGIIVTVPFGNMTLEGFVLELSNNKPSDI